MPGKMPASKAPRKNRSADVLAKLFAPAMAVQKAPKPITKKPSQLYGTDIVISRQTYDIKNAWLGNLTNLAGELWLRDCLVPRRWNMPPKRP